MMRGRKTEDREFESDFDKAVEKMMGSKKGEN